jgi:hypothetical protein
MKKFALSLLLCLFSLTASAESWFYLAGSADGKVKVYGDAKSLDLENHKGWIKIVDEEQEEASDVLYRYTANCKANKVKNTMAIINLKDDKRFFAPTDDGSEDTVTKGEMNEYIYTWLCEGRYDWLHHMGIKPEHDSGFNK